VFVDTSAFFAVIDQDDGNHERALKQWSALLVPENVLVTTNYVVVEAATLIHRRLGPRAAAAFHADMMPLVHVQFVSAQQHGAAVAASLLAARRGPSIVDCASFEVMRGLGVADAFTFDRHFTAQGFDVKP